MQLTGEERAGRDAAPGRAGWRVLHGALLAFCVVALATGCRLRQEGVPAVRLDAARLAAMDAAVEAHIASGNLPGGVLHLEHRGVVHARPHGRRAVEPEPEAMSADTLFDAASLTKVLATAPAIMKLVDQGRIDLDRPVAAYLEAFGVRGKETVTVRQLLTHTSGLRPGLSLRGDWAGSAAALELACAEAPTQEPGTRFVYSDINFIVLGALVERVDGRPLDTFAARELFEPLGMRDTAFHRVATGPGAPVELEGDRGRRCAPTERLADGRVLRGVVHDPTARRMGGVAGHAGVFTTAEDVARFARMLLAGGRGGNGRVLSAASVAAMTRVQTGDGLPARGLGWDIDSPYAGPRGLHFPVGSYGHTGWTGTSLWVDPGSSTFIIFLSNRNHPTEAGDVRALRRELGTLAAEALGDGPWPWRQTVPVSAHPSAETLEPVGVGVGAGAADAPGTPGDAGASGDVLNGIDVLVRDGFASLRGRRVGLVTNHTGQDRGRRPTIDLLHAAPGVELVALFSPEHGIRGVLDANVDDGRDERTGLPVYSLYGERRAPTEAQLEGIDVLVFDIQDIGCRFYTYISTLGNCMEVAARLNRRFVVLDRVNPIRGDVVEGPVLTGRRSFVAWHEIPLRHGMTVGELARLFRQERGMELDLGVVPVSGWRRDQWLDATGLPWTNPSPNMRSLTAATLYPGVGVLEFCNLSVGRGTGTPFEVLGAPYVDDRVLAAALNRLDLPGVRFIPVRFTPVASRFEGRECGGVQILLTDRERFRAGWLGVGLARTLQQLYPGELGLDRMENLLGDRGTLEAIRSGQPVAAIVASWQPGLDTFLQRRRPHLLY